ncbi:SCP2 sterol-binding domain-containing protein [Candidatus Thioglobus sp.]|uniref:ubiquinone biosynthesis accessory factor UbiJ n=1 Tax=Candidatus Thioglobus sp. TaxID=2026721 RepID=UPI002619F20E|nr:SCP2 sterol-binding domain-containing protein [Candidatus Thioglobus sp.]MDG2394798.1 SCP2 sterol-binding domain-containing protein [Candidatus Thioglobus sp.]
MQHFVLEQALNLLIEKGSINLKPLDQKVVRFSLQDLPLDVNFLCTNNRIFVLNDIDRPSNVAIKLKASAFFSLFKGEDLAELLRQDQITIHGDVKTAQLLVDLLQSIEIDLEEILSRYTGDIIAHEAGKVAANFKKSTKHSSSPINVIKDGFSNLLINPTVSELYKNKQQ